jgi:glycosyltransferase involved in cell wall biosynthesis
VADSRRRVLLACDFFVRYTSMLAGGLELAGAEIALLGRDHDEEFGGVPGAAAGFVAMATGPGARRLTIPGRVRTPAGLVAAARSRRATRRFSPDVVHLQTGAGNDPRLILASCARPRRFALTVHDPVRHPGEESSRARLFGDPMLIRGAGLIFVHAEALREELTEEARPRAPIVVVPHGVDPVGEARPLPEKPSILFFGRLGYYKGVDVLLDAMEGVWATLPEARLTIAGNGELEKHPSLADPRVEVRVEHVPDRALPDLFGAAGCVALPYRQASQSGVGSLAKQYARPLVVSAVGGLPELVADGSGITVATEDPGALAAGLVEVLDDRGAAQRMGEAGFRTAQNGADWRSVGESTLRAYEEHLLGGRGSG